MESRFLSAARRKALRESRTILVYRSSGRLFMVPEIYFEPQPDIKVQERFEPPEAMDMDLDPVEDFKTLSAGDRVVVQRPGDETEVCVVTHISGGMRIFVNGGDSFRMRDGVLWGGGDSRITHRAA